MAQAGHNQPHHTTEGFQSLLPDHGPSSSQVLAVVTLFPVGGILLILAGLTLTGTVIGLALATPVFVIFSPIILPAVIVMGLSVAGFLTSGAFGVTGLSSLSCLAKNLRGVGASMPDNWDNAKRRMQEGAGYAGQRMKDMGQGNQNKGQEGGRT